jgi:hypothetical protein
MSLDKVDTSSQLGRSLLDRREFFRKSILISGAVVTAASGIVPSEGIASAHVLTDTKRRRHNHYDTVPFYRLYNSDYHDHFYTTSRAEDQEARNKYGYQDEGTACYVYSDNSYDDRLAKFYRLYNPDKHDHFYTTDRAEARQARRKYGYNDEGTACYVYKHDSYDNNLVPLYRLYNPDVVDHFYTTSDNERQNAIDNDGYNDEGIACYVYDRRDYNR